MFADYFLQTGWMLDRRNTYLHAGRAAHAAIHAGFTFVCFVLAGAPLLFTLLLVLAEWVVHFHIDFWKGWLTSGRALTPEDAGYWRASGIDQALHQLTYVAMIGLWLAMPASV
jgi:hypothetical protein